jgi:hypothetical protein
VNIGSTDAPQVRDMALYQTVNSEAGVAVKCETTGPGISECAPATEWFDRQTERNATKHQESLDRAQHIAHNPGREC